VIRPAAPSDAAACAAIYAPFVTDGVESFEETPPGETEMARRMAAAHLWLVAVEDGAVVGYAYGGRHRERAAYRLTVEVSVYLAPAARGRGLGRALYTELFTALAERGFRTALAGVTLPNAASVGLHEAMGFTPVGVFRAVGWKFGAWHDVGWWQRSLEDWGA
jgi:phosphinothricin acetyltransferase